MQCRPPRMAELSWRDGATPVSAAFGEGYFGASDGLGEARHVFLGGNDLPARFRDGFHIAELGFGTGLNAVAVAHAWRESGTVGTLRITSFEAWPMAAEDMARALAPWPDLEPLARALVAAWAAGARRCELPGADVGGAVVIEVIEGDARLTLPRWPGRADAWFLDGFSPARNPELWEPGLMAEVAARSAPGATFATYSAAGAVRSALTAAGFTVERVRGFANKKHMTRGRLIPGSGVTGEPGVEGASP